MQILLALSDIYHSSIATLDAFEDVIVHSLIESNLVIVKKFRSVDGDWVEYLNLTETGENRVKEFELG